MYFLVVHSLFSLDAGQNPPEDVSSIIGGFLRTVSDFLSEIAASVDGSQKDNFI
jgi:hypothetical protein